MQENRRNSSFKYSRVLTLYTKLIKGEVISKAEEAENFGVNQRSIQRDIDDLRTFFEEQRSEGEPPREILYSRELGGFFLAESSEYALTDSDILSACKAVLCFSQIDPESRARIAEKLVRCCAAGRKQELLHDMVFGKS